MVMKVAVYGGTETTPAAREIAHHKREDSRQRPKGAPTIPA